MTDMELKDLLEKCSTLSCPHGSPIFEEIYDLTELEKISPANSGSQGQSQVALIN